MIALYSSEYNNNNNNIRGTVVVGKNSVQKVLERSSSDV